MIILDLPTAKGFRLRPQTNPITKRAATTKPNRKLDQAQPPEWVSRPGAASVPVSGGHNDNHPKTKTPPLILDTRFG
jgi:hypothetical protein